MSLSTLNLIPRQISYINYIKNNVVPNLLGTQEQRAQTAAIVTWWALKEGILNLPNPWRHSLCSAGGDHQIGDLDVCQSGVWQVGLSGIQVNSATLSQVEQLASQIYPGKSIQSILRSIAIAANVNENTIQAIENSTGNLRKSWLLRDPAISFTIQRPFVEKQCVNGSVSWCYGNWDTAKQFASNKSRIQEVVSILKNYFITGITSNIFPWLLLIGSLGAIGYTVAKQRHLDKVG